MTITKEAYVDIEEKLEKITKLIEEDSKNDPPNNPYHSKYSARQLLIGVKANLENLRRLQPQSSQEYIKLTALLSLSLFYLAKIASDTEETSVASKHITRCLEVLDNYHTEPEFVIVALNAFNLQALLNSNNNPELSKSILNKCISVYKQFKDSNKAAIYYNDLFKINATDFDREAGTQFLEKAHTLTLYYLAQIYGTLKQELKSSVCCHITLKRQLQYNDYEPVEWSLNAATLSQFFTEKCCFKQARHHLATSSYVLQKYEDQLNAETRHNEEYEARVETFKHRSADIARCWAKYGLALLSTSRERLLKQADDQDFNIDIDLAALDLTDSNITHDVSKLEFDVDVSVYENQITDNFLLTLDDARMVFLNVKTWLSKAHEYYTLNNLASDYIEILQDQSQLYLYLLFFDDDPANQAKLHKRRADLLEDVLRQINPTFYMAYCKQLWFESAEIYRDIFYIKMEKLQESKEHPAPHTLSKINSLLNKSITHYNNFINSFEDAITKKLPDIVESNYQKPFLLAFFNMGALNSRFVTLDKNLILAHTQDSFNAYKYVADYCERNVEAVDILPVEINICREMVILLPVKMAKLRSELQL